MNLLEKAMRQKALRESNPSGRDRIVSSAAKFQVPVPAVTRPVSPGLLVAGAVGLSLAALGIGVLYMPAQTSPSPDSPAPAASTPQNRDQPVVHASPAADSGKTDDRRQQVIAFVDTWRSAWASKEVDKYLSCYAPEFKPSQGLPRPTWENQRRFRINKYRKIEIALSNLSVSVKNDTATVEFIQAFKADGYTEAGLHKQLDLKLQDSRWMIVKETSR